MVQSGFKLGKHRVEPVWKGPMEEGVTQSLLGRYLCCKERFRILVVEGLKPQESFNHKLEYGNMWHLAEETLAQDGQPQPEEAGRWEERLREYAKKLCKKYPTQQGEIDKWYNACRIQFPEYVKFWAIHPDVVERTPLLQEEPFNVLYMLPSKRVVKLRGKWDSVDLVGSFRSSAETGRPLKGIWLQENKTKGDVREGQIQRQLSFDLQTMLYLVALQRYQATEMVTPNSDFWRENQHLDWRSLSAPILGVRYNVIRRPFSGGKGNIIQGKGTAGTKCPKCKGEGKCIRSLDVARGDHFMKTCEKCGGIGRVGGKAPETKEAYYARVGQYIRDEPETYFFRWQCQVTSQDLAKFRKECLDPILENLCDDYEWWKWCQESNRLNLIYNGESRNECFPNHCPRHFRLPFGTYNALAEGGSSELDGYLETGDETGLERVTNLFPELT